jgi:arylsulfatase A-like enzyme
MKTSFLLGAVSTLILLQSFVHGSEQKKRAEPEKPNIVFIFTDDQDFKLNSLDYMPNVQKYLVQEGTVYNNHYATIAVCCPSRVGLLRGQYAHNTKYGSKQHSLILSLFTSYSLL